MGTVDSFCGIKIKVNARDHNPPHCHVEGNGGKARYNIVTMEWMESEGFTAADRNRIEIVIKRRIQEIRELWSEYHDE